MANKDFYSRTQIGPTPGTPRFQPVRSLLVNVLAPLLLVAPMIMAPSSARSQSAEPSQVGTSMANFLKIGVGARATGMGNAFVALSDDASSLYWNPGGVGTLQNNEVIFHTTGWILGSQLYFVGATLNLGGLGVVGLSINTFDSGEIEETTIFEPEGTGRMFSATNFAAGLTYARQLTDRFSAGATLKYVSERLDRTTANAIAIDVGSVFVTDFLNNLRIGFNLSNLGSQMRLGGSDLLIQVPVEPGTKFVPADLATESWDLPLLFRFGVATDVVTNSMQRFTVSTDVLDSRDFTYRIHTGAEWAYREMLFVRGGYKFNYDETTFSLGAGLQLPEVSGFGFRFDYSYEDFGMLEAVQRITVSLSY